MTDFADVERFGREHADCGGITPSAAAQMIRTRDEVRGAAAFRPPSTG